MKKIHFDILTIFPEVFGAYCSCSILGRAQKEKRVSITAHDLRTFSDDRRGRVDDSPYGGGPGMLMRVVPFDRALKALRSRRGKKTERVILLSAKGRPFTAADAVRLSKYRRLVLLCGRYEGVDERVAEGLVDEEISIGPYVLTGGELPAMIVVDAVARQIPGVLGDAASLDEESHTTLGVMEAPQYTRPEEYRGMKVPDVLLSGNHKKILEWRKTASIRNTLISNASSADFPAIASTKSNIKKRGAEISGATRH